MIYALQLVKVADKLITRTVWKRKFKTNGVKNALSLAGEVGTALSVTYTIKNISLKI